MKKLLQTFAVCVLFCACIAGMGACNAPADDDLQVYAPDGAPALSLLGAIDAEEKQDGAFDFTVVDSGKIQTFVTGKAPKADLCILPVNLASKLLGKGDVYQMLGTVTHGNLFFLTSGAEHVALTRSNLKETLTGKKVGVVQLPNVPGLTLRAVLADYGAEVNILAGAQEEGAPMKVNLVAFSLEDVTPGGGCDYYLVPEPAASTKIKGTQNTPTPFRMAGDLQALYGDGEGYPQAVAVAKKSVIESRLDDVKTFIGYLEGAETYLTSATPEAVLRLLDGVREEGLFPSFNANNLTKTVLANCSVRYTAASVCKEEVGELLEKLIAVSADSAATPADAFFYLG